VSTVVLPLPGATGRRLPSPRPRPAGSDARGRKRCGVYQPLLARMVSAAASGENAGMRTLFTLVHSPLVGPLTWQATAEVLRERGRQVAVPSLADGVEGGPPYYARLAGQASEQIRAAVGGAPVVLVGHSGAGALLPSIAEAVSVPVTAAVFVDAILPHPGLTWFGTAPDELGAQLRDLARDGRLPPWDRWFPPGVVEALLPDEELRARFLGELPSLPLAYFQERAPSVAGWPSAVPCGYLRLSEAYETTATEAERRGWPVVREAADHLAMLHRPDRVADLLAQVLDAL
jgi:hypothetical protein